MARKRPLVNSQHTALPEGYEYAPRSPELAPTKDEKGKWHFPIKASKGSEVSTTVEWQWADAAVELVQALLQNDAPALKHCLAECIRADEELDQLLATIHTASPERLPALVAQIQHVRSWSKVSLTEAQWQCEALIRSIAPHAETGAKAKTYRGKLTGSKYGAKSVQVRQDKNQPRDERIYREFTQAGLTRRGDIAKKKDALGRKESLSQKEIGRINKKQGKLASGET